MIERCGLFCRLPQIPLKTMIYGIHTSLLRNTTAYKANEIDVVRNIPHAKTNGKIAARRNIFLTQSEEGYHDLF